MKALSLWQPWATLIAIGAKSIETRSWSTTYRGPLAIHAAKKWDRATSRMCADEPFRSQLLAAGYEPQRSDWGLPLGAVVALARVEDCFQFKAADMVNRQGERRPLPDEMERAFGDYFPGRFGLILRDVRKLERPIPYRGHQGPFDIPDEMLADSATVIANHNSQIAHAVGGTQ
jgi:hypothetical protein